MTPLSALKTYQPPTKMRFYPETLETIDVDWDFTYVS